MHEIEVKRHLDEKELAAVTELLTAASEADAHPALGEHAWLDLVQGGREGFAGLVAWEPGHSHPVGYAQLSLGPHDGVADGSSWGLEVVVDPHHRTPGNTVAVDLVKSAITLIGEEGGGHLHLWVSQPGALPRAHGCGRWALSWPCSIPNAPSAPDGGARHHQDPPVQAGRG